MALALENDIHSIAFPAISTGVYGYPKDKACKIAVKTIKEYDKYDIDVYFVCFDSETYGLYNDLI